MHLLKRTAERPSEGVSLSSCRSKREKVDNSEVSAIIQETVEVEPGNKGMLKFLMFDSLSNLQVTQATVGMNFKT